MKQCKNFRLYKGLRAPRCNGGDPCDACIATYRKAVLARASVSSRKARKTLKDVKITMGAEYSAETKRDRAMAIAPEPRRTCMPPVLGAPYGDAPITAHVNQLKSGLWGLESSKTRELPVCEFCHEGIEGTYASIGGNIEPFISPKFYHLNHVPHARPYDPYVEFARRAWSKMLKSDAVRERIREAASDFCYKVFSWRGRSAEFMQAQVSRLTNTMVDALAEAMVAEEKTDD